MIENQDTYESYVPSLKRRILVSDEITSAPMWLLTFTDVVALMLTFFVLLYSMSEPIVQKWEKKIGITSSATGSYSGAANKAGANEGVNISKVDYQAAENLDYLQAVLDEILEKHSAISFIKIVRKGNDLALVFTDSYDDIDNKIMLFLKELSPTLNAMDNRITIVGNDDHADVFLYLQQLGEKLKKFGYKKPFPLAVKNNSLVGDVHLAIYIQPHTSKRYE